MSDRPRRKWAEIQVDLFKEAARRHADPDSGERFEELFARLVPPIRPRDAGAPSRPEAEDARRETPRSSGTPEDRG